MRSKMLVGMSEFGSLIFIEPEITKDNKFSLCSEMVMPFNLDRATDDWFTEQAEELIECLSVEQKLEMLEQFDCKPSELVHYLTGEMGDDVRDYIDCSLYPEEIDTAHGDYVFTSERCGQADLRDVVKYYFMPKPSFSLFMEWWDCFHLKKVDDDTAHVMRVLIDAVCKSEEEEKQWIAEKLDEIHR